MRAYLRHKTYLVFGLLAVVLTGMTAGNACADWNGTATGSASSSEIGDQSSSSWDQQYTLYTSGRPTSNIRYSLGSLFRHLRSKAEGSPSIWLTETRPSGAVNWSTSVFDLRGDGSYRSDRDKLGSTKLTSGSSSIFGQTVWTSLPRLFASWSWAKNVNDLDLIGYDTRTRTLTAGTNYSTHNFYANYEYEDLLTRNEISHLDRVSQSHSGRADYTKSLFARAANISASYQASSRKETDNAMFTGEALIVLRANAGLYAADPSPEFDALEPSQGLADGILEVAASEAFDLVNGETHNFGLDFGQTVAIDHLHLYVDSLAALPLTWTIWQSADNLNWSPVVSNASAPFNSIFLRYEFTFDDVQSRYIKLTVSPQLLNTPLRVTEIRGLITTANPDQEENSTDQRGSARLLVTPSEWLSWELSGDAIRQSASLSTLAREEDALQTSMRLDPAKMADLILRYQWSRSNYTDTDQDFAYTSSAGAVLHSQWNRSVVTNITTIRTEEKSGEFLQRRSDRGRFEARTILLPALRFNSQFAYSEDERFDSPDKIYSRTFTNDFEGEPTDRSQITVTYRYETRSARVSAVRKYQSTVGGRFNYRLTDTINLTGNATAMSDPTREDRAYDGIVSWTPTYKISLGGSFNRIEGSQNVNANQYSLQAVYNWSLKTEISASYSLNEREGEDTATSGRVSMFIRF